MSKTTTNYGFIKPELTDSADITQMNPNWDAVDTQLKGVNDKVTAVDGKFKNYATTEAVNKQIETINEQLENVSTDAGDLTGTLPINHGGTGATKLADAQSNLGIVPMDDIASLHIWKKYTGDPTGYSQTEESNVRLITKLYNQYTGSTTNQRIFYADSFEIVDGKFSLAHGSSLTAPTAANITAIRGKYAAAQYASGLSYVYLIPENAVFTDVGTGSNQTTFVQVDKATKTTMSEFVNLVASKTNNSYPTNGTHTDGYWYKYSKQLGDNGYDYGVTDLTAGSSALETGKLYFVYE